MCPERCVTYVSGPDPLRYGGEGGIRTHGRVSPTLAFEASSFDRSDTSPRESQFSSLAFASLVCISQRQAFKFASDSALRRQAHRPTTATTEPRLLLHGSPYS